MIETAAAERRPLAPGDALLSVHGLTKDYPVRAGWFGSRQLRAVDHVDLTVRAGETLGIVGESGSGKTTLARLVLQLERPTSGSVVFEGTDLAGLSPEDLRAKRRRMQAVFQDPFSSLDPRMTTAEIVGEPLFNYGVRRRAARDARVAEMLELCGLSSQAMRRYPHEFSGGQRQRIAIARALVLRPSLLVADEPVASLDVSIQAQIINLLVELQRELGLTYVLITHDMAVIKPLSDRIAVMYLGTIVEVGPTDQVVDRPLHPYATALVRAVPTIGQTAGSRKPILLEGDPPSPLDVPSGCRFHPRCPIARLPICREVVPGLDPHEPDRLAACHFAGELR